MSNVVELIPNNAIALDATSIGARVRTLADDIEAGKFAGIERIIVLIESPEGVEPLMLGRPATRMEIVGILEYAKLDIIMPSGSDQS